MNRQEFLKTMVVGGGSVLAARWARGDEPAEPRTFTYKTAGGCEVKLDAFGSDPKTRKPVIVHIHGGALIMGSRGGTPQWLKSQSERVVISVDYRLAPETKLAEIIMDLQDAFKWIHQKGPQLLNIDPGNIVVEGESAGGYLTLMTGFCIKPLPRALISISGYGDIVNPWISQPSEHYLQDPHVPKDEAYASVVPECVTDGKGTRHKYYLYCRQNGIWPQEVSGHNPATEPKWFDRYCPVRNVSAKYPPTVLIHGTADTDVAYEASDEMDKAFTRFNVAHKFITIPGGRHVLGGSSDSEKAAIYEQALAFVKEHASL